MMKIFTFTLVLCASTALSALTAAPALADVEADVAAYMEFIRTHKYDVPESTPDMKAQDAAVVAALWKYIGDPSENVRVSLFGKAETYASLDNVERKVRQEAVELMLSAFEVEPFPALISNVAEKLAMLPRSLFSRRAKEIITRLMSRDVIVPEVVRLVGVAGVDTLQANRRLREIMEAEENTPIATIPTERAKKRHRANLAAKKTARWALASMGDETAIQELIAAADAAPEALDRLGPFHNLAYTRQPKAIAALVRYVFSEERLPPLMGTAPGEKLAHRAIYYLAQVVEGFPKQALEGTEEALAEARQWLTQQGIANLRIKD